MAQHKVGFSSGINKDIAKDKYPNTAYFHANNIRVITNAGLSTGSIENEKGNSLLVDFPEVPAQYKVTIATASVTISGNVVGLSVADTNKEAYEKLVANAGVAALITANSIKVWYNNDGVYIQVLLSSITVTGSVTTSIAAQSTIRICGWCRLNEWLIVFTSNGEGADPVNTICQIWKFKFTEGSRTTINGASGTTLDPTQHLRYNNSLNFSTSTYIRDEVANFENDTTGRVYWTDFYNQIRVINVLDDDAMTLKPSDLNLVSDVTLSKPIIQTVDDGGNLPAGAVYQAYYRLLHTDGRQTIFSPGSQIIDLQDQLSYGTSIDYYDIESSSSDVSTKKSITVEVKDVDTDYNIIEFYLVVWEGLNQPSIYKVDDRFVDNETESFTYSSLDNAYNIPLVSFMNIGLPFTAKTIDNRDKVLVAGNIEEESFDVDFDARAYRFNTDGVPNFDLFEADGTSTNYNFVSMGAVPDTSDAINPTNRDDAIDVYGTDYSVDNATNRQIYKSNGSTIGGEGPNVSYTFTTNERVGSSGSWALDTGTAALDEGLNKTDTKKSSGATIDLGETLIDGTAITYNVGDETNSCKSAKLNAIVTGYARGEVYPFGIVFFSKSGQRSPVHWIGDIKFPEPSLGDGYKVSDVASGATFGGSLGNLPSDTNAETYTYDLGITFTVDISSIKDDISGFKIVRMERSITDRSRFGTGIVSNLVAYQYGTNQTGSLAYKYANSAVLRSLNAISDQVDVFGDSKNDDLTGAVTLFLNDHASIYGSNNSTTVNGDFSKYLLTLTAPFSEFRQYTGFNLSSTSDYIRDYAYYSCVEDEYNDNLLTAGTTTGGNFNDVEAGFLFRAKKFRSLSGIGTPQTHQNYKIDEGYLMAVGEWIPNDGSVIASFTDGSATLTFDGILNTSYALEGSSAGDNAPMGLGTQKQLLRLDTSAGTWYAASGSLNNYNAGANTTWQTDIKYLKEVAYCRILSDQYGGNTYEARSKRQYIDTGHYQAVSNQNATTSYTFDVYGGDTYVASYDREYIRQHWNGIVADGQFNDYSGNQERISVGLIFCAEAPINFALRTGLHFGGEDKSTVNNYFRGSVSTSLDRGDLSRTEDFGYRPRHNQENNVREDYIAEDYLAADATQFPVRIRVSNSKTDGELTDSWRTFPSLQYEDVKGSLGPINKIISYQDQLLFFQDRGVGVLPINERAVISDVTGAELVLGNGNLIGKYRYIDETSGTKHQASVVATPRGIYYYDSLQQKIMMVKGGSLSEVLGLSSYFHNEVKEIIRDKDELYVATPEGVHTAYDAKNERVIFTILGGNNILTLQDQTTTYVEVGEIVYLSIYSKYYICLIQGDYVTSDVTDANNFSEVENYYPGITLSFNEKLNAFESFHSYKTGNFLTYDDKLLSISPKDDRNEIYIHEEGNYGSFYGDYHPSDITLVVMPNPNMISKFTNLEYYSEVTLSKENVVGDTFDSILCWNNHQNTGEITLTVGTIAKQRLQTWRHKFKRDAIGTTNNSISRPSMRNYYMFMKLSYTNEDNKRIVLSDVVISYTPTRM